MVWGGLSLTILAIVVAFFLRRPQEAETPIPWPEAWAKLQVPDFKLTNQFGKEVTLADLKGQVWVADIIFARCPSACPLMSQQMSELQAALPPNSPVRIVSITSDPTNDTPAVLKDYANRFGAKERWMFLTGPKPAVNELAVNGLKLISMDTEPGKRASVDDLFVHSTIFVLVDRKGRIRGSVETQPTEGDPTAALHWKEKLLRALDQLTREAP